MITRTRSPSPSKKFYSQNITPKTQDYTIRQRISMNRIEVEWDTEWISCSRSRWRTLKFLKKSLLPGSFYFRG